MFEAKITIPGGESPVGDTEGLNELGWRELSVRFAMAREFRQVLGGKRQGDGGSFNLASARHLAAFWDGNPAVNPIALSNGKITCDNDAAVSRIPVTGDRGK